MLYFIKSHSVSVAKNGNPFYKLNLISEEGAAVDATCFTSVEKDLSNTVIESNLDSTAQYPKVSEAELMSARPLTSLEEIPSVFSKYKQTCPSKEEFIQVVTKLLEEAGKLKSKLGIKLLEDCEELYNKYSYATAAKVMHHAFLGGLALHTYEMLNYLYALVKDDQKFMSFKVNILHCTIGILYHDYGKLEEYKGMEFTETLALTPHNFLGAKEIELRYSEYLKPRTLKLIQHIILSHHGNLEWGATCVPATLEAFLVHHIDMLSGHGNAMASCVNMEKCAATRSMVVVP